MRHAFRLFSYTLKRVPDSQFGSRKDDGNWTGMVGQLQKRVSRVHGRFPFTAFSCVIQVN